MFSNKNEVKTLDNFVIATKKHLEWLKHEWNLPDWDIDIKTHTDLKNLSFIIEIDKIKYKIIINNDISMIHSKYTRFNGYNLEIRIVVGKKGKKELYRTTLTFGELIVEIERFVFDCCWDMKRDKKIIKGVFE